MPSERKQPWNEWWAKLRKRMKMNEKPNLVPAVYFSMWRSNKVKKSLCNISKRNGGKSEWRVENKMKNASLCKTEVWRVLDKKNSLWIRMGTLPVTDAVACCHYITFNAFLSRINYTYTTHEKKKHIYAKWKTCKIVGWVWALNKCIYEGFGVCVCVFLWFAFDFLWDPIVTWAIM